MTKKLRLINPYYGFKMGMESMIDFTVLLSIITFFIFTIEILILFVKFEPIEPQEIRFLIAIYVVSLLPNWYYRTEIIED